MLNCAEFAKIIIDTFRISSVLFKSVYFVQVGSLSPGITMQAHYLYKKYHLCNMKTVWIYGLPHICIQNRQMFHVHIYMIQLVKLTEQLRK